MDPYQNIDNQNQQGYGGLGDPYGNPGQDFNTAGDLSQQASPQGGFDMTQPYKPPQQTPNGMPGAMGGDFATLQSPQSKTPFIIIGVIVLLIAISGGVGFFIFSQRSSQADSVIENSVEPSLPADNEQQGPQGLTVDTTGEDKPEEDVSDELPEDTPDSVVDETEEVLDTETESTESAMSEQSDMPLEQGVSFSILEDDTQSFSTVDEPGAILITAGSEEGIDMTAFDLLIQFDPAAFDITEDDIVLLDESFDRFVFYKEHEDGLAHLTISGVRSPDVEDLSTGADLLRLTFIPTAPGSYEFAVMDGYESETTKFIDGTNDSIPLTLPDPVIVEIE